MAAAAALIRSPSVSEFPSVPLSFALSRGEDAAWSEGPVAGWRRRDLLMGEASKGQIGCALFRAESAGESPRWSDGAHVRFRFAYVTSGSVSFTLGGETITLEAGDTAMTDALTLARSARWSADFEALEFVAPADPAVSPVPTLDIAVEPTIEKALAGITRDRPEFYFTGEGPRRFLAYRDLKTIEPTGRRIHTHQVRAVDTPEGGTGWHVHSMSQLFYVFRGWVDIGVEGRGKIRMNAGDAMCVASDMRHNVSKFSADYDLIEICLPADYSTTPTPPPDDA